MPMVSIHVAASGTPLSNGETSLVGHMWVELIHEERSECFGFAPDEGFQGEAFAPGRVWRHDCRLYTERAYSRSLDIGLHQYHAMRAFVLDPASCGFDTDYNGFTNSCIDFVWKALEVGGLNPSRFEGDLWPTNNIDELMDIGKVEMA